MGEGRAGTGVLHRCYASKNNIAKTCFAFHSHDVIYKIVRVKNELGIRELPVTDCKIIFLN